MPDAVVESSMIVFFVLSSVLALLLTRAYLRKGEKSYMYWSIGFWFFALSDLLEVLFAFGAYSQVIAQLYLFVIAFMVIPLAMGSLRLIKSEFARLVYFGYSFITALVLAYFTFTSTIGDMVSGGMVNGNIPMNVLISSSLITFPATVIIIAIAAVTLVRMRKLKMAWIILGMLLFAFGGMLYIASMPVAIYYVEFFGLVALWLGFFDFATIGSVGSRRKRRR